ncbi:MAG: SDR family NAD(P)-dependent oxidoreductase [Alphaproteobacteria bacterium]|nr:SDR family NAD(P)-dependent oxidoreductase [Alphaproteobacteria bacterium]
MTVNLKGRVALVTGASRGIGAAAAKDLAAAGAHVILMASDSKKMRTVQKEILAQNGKASIYTFDLSQTHRIGEISHRLRRQFGRLDIFVGNAAINGELTEMKDQSLKAWQKTLDINLTANARLIKTLHPLLEKSDAARVMFVTSGAALQQSREWGAYGVSKAALETMANIYADETRGTNIRVNLIDPGDIRTDMHYEVSDKAFVDKLPTPESIAPVFSRLASPKCRTHGKRIEAWAHPAAQKKQKVRAPNP